MNLFSPDTSLPTAREEATADSIASERPHRSIKVSATSHLSYCKDEQDIRRAVRALGALDDDTLRNIGIRDRSEIEFTVRFCRAC